MNQMLDRLQASAERQRRFVADASHELRTPLAATRADLEVALAHPDEGRWTDSAQALLQENQRMEQLVADLLYVARADGEVARAPMLPVDLHEVVLAEVGRLPELGRDVVHTGRVSEAVVLGHRDDLARVVRNLLDNAVRYASSRVEVSLASMDGEVVLSIDDDGPGIAAQHRETVFERFGRVDDSRSRQAGGSGLGLAIAKDIVLRHQGCVSVSESEWGGALFSVRLPAD
jgi:signal transduction histidine kinase